MSERKRLRISITDVQRIQEALTYVEGVYDDSGRCAVDAEHRRAMRLYLQTWVAPPLRATLKRILGEEDVS